MNLTAEQQQVVDIVAGPNPPRLALLTGGPGVGKTTTIKAVIAALEQRGRSFALCAPSGKAAKRMEEATGAEAQTIHRMLFLRPGSDAAQPADAQVVIVDESSMVDVRLMATLLRACYGGEAQTVLLVGDPEQLPPVGAGRPFHDMLEHKAGATVTLTQVHRQARESGIIRAAYRIRAGKAPEWTEDFELVEVEDAAAVPEIAHDIGGLSDPDDVQILSPQSTLAAGTKAINDYADEHRPGGLPAAKRVRGLFAAGTKVIHTQNDYTMQIFNGELGWVVEASEGKHRRADRAVVEIAGGRKVYTGAKLKMLKPAWALTVHKSQGSEWDTVVVVAHPQHTYMLSRSLLYVAATRARKRVVVVGTQGAVEGAVGRVRDLRRRTMLARWLKVA